MATGADEPLSPRRSTSTSLACSTRAQYGHATPFTRRTSYLPARAKLCLSSGVELGRYADILLLLLAGRFPQDFHIHSRVAPAASCQQLL